MEAAVHPVHNHSEYSALDGFGTPSEIAERIQELGLPGAFLTDHGTVAGWHAFAREMAKAGLYYGLGMEAYMARTSRLEHPKRVKGEKGDAFHLILLAQNLEGYGNLLRLSDEANRSGFYYYPRVDWELLRKWNAGLIATSACLGSLVCEGIRHDDLTPFHQYREIFGDRFYVELNTYDSPDQVAMNQRLAEIAYEFGCPLLVANDAHYPRKEDYYHHEMLLAMQMNQQLDMEDPHHPPSLYIMSEPEVRDALKYLPASQVHEAIENTNSLAEQCQVTIEHPKSYFLPRYKGEDDEPADEVLRQLVIEGVKERDIKMTPEVRERLVMEYDAITEAGLADYFLIVRDYISWAERRDILTGPGRGSVGGSLLAYVIGITYIDPLKYGLIFERFWNPGRSAGLPDIDTDFEQARRNEVKQYLVRKYGADRVLGIGNHIRMQPKSAIDKVAKATWGDETPYLDMKAIKTIIDTTIDAGKQASWAEIFDMVGEDLRPWVTTYPKLFQDAVRMTGRLSAYGIHASAVVISSIDLPDYVPAMLRTSKGDDGTSASGKVLVTQLEMHGVEEDAKLPKFDLLGLRNLDTLKLTAKLAGVPTFDYRDVDYEGLEDSFWEQIDKGQTLGLFQIEDGNAARRIAKGIRPDSISDLGAIVALNRPGPLRGGVVDRYIARRNDAEPVVYPHPTLEPILKESYGDFLYQEQVIAYFRLIGYDLGEADHIRKMLGKKLVSEMRAEMPRYLSRATQHMPKETAEAIWGSIEDFSKYSFNKAHATGYGMITAWTMYAKWKWPTQFIMASIMTNPEKVGAYVQEGYRLGVKISGPDINHSQAEISEKDAQIFFGLADIKGVGKAAVRWIIDHRPYTSHEHFLGVLELAQADWEDHKEGRSPRQTVPAQMIRALYDAGAFDSIHDRGISEAKKLDMEEELLGIPLWTDERIERLAGDGIERLESLEPLSSLDTEEQETHRVPGVITKVTMTTTRPSARYQPNRKMGFVILDWKGEQARLAAFPDTWDEYSFMLRRGTVGEFLVKTGKRGAQLIGGKIVGKSE